MVSQAEVDKWLKDFQVRLLKHFGERLVFLGHHGSWARGEARPESDIDTIVVLDSIDSEDLISFGKIVHSMPDADSLASGVFYSVSEIKSRPSFELVEYFYDCKNLYGKLDGIIDKPTSQDFIERIRVFAANNQEAARHYLLFPHNLNKVIHKLFYPFKNCFYALQSWIYLKEGKYILKKDEIINLLSDDDDKDVVRVARDWKDSEKDREERPLYYIELLERWCRKMLSRL